MNVVYRSTKNIPSTVSRFYFLFWTKYVATSAIDPEVPVLNFLRTLAVQDKLVDI